MASFARAPDNLMAGRKAGNAEMFSLLREPGGKAIRLRLPLKSTVAETISFLVGYVIPVRTDLTGLFSGWYRLDQDGKPLSPTSLMELVDPQKPLLIRSVPNQIAFADIEVVGGPAPARFVAPVGLAVPVACLVDHLEAWLGLPDARWRLHRDGRPLDQHAILADEPCSGMIRLQLRITAGDEPELG